MKVYHKLLYLALFIFMHDSLIGGSRPMQVAVIHNDDPGIEIATIGGGCFWCLEAIFEDLNGVEKVEVGYAGGHVTDPTYEQVIEGNTGHAEVVQITFRTEVISFEEILKVFFSIHDPTSRNRQGADVGSQYRSIILFHNDIQKFTSENVISEIQSENLWKHPIMTEIEPYQSFSTAEAYHQNYFKNNPEDMYCQLVIAPKVNKFRKANSLK